MHLFPFIGRGAKIRGGWLDKDWSFGRFQELDEGQGTRVNMLLGPRNHSGVPFVTVTRRTALRFPAFLWPLTSTRHNHSHLTSIRESSSPVATNQALYITALKPDTHCLVSRLQALHRSHHLPAGSPLLCGCLPPVDSTKGRDKDY